MGLSCKGVLRITYLWVDNLANLPHLHTCKTHIKSGAAQKSHTLTPSQAKQRQNWDNCFFLLSLYFCFLFSLFNTTETHFRFILNFEFFFYSVFIMIIFIVTKWIIFWSHLLDRHFFGFRTIPLSFHLKILSYKSII